METRLLRVCGLSQPCSLLVLGSVTHACHPPQVQQAEAGRPFCRVIAVVAGALLLPLTCRWLRWTQKLRRAFVQFKFHLLKNLVLGPNRTASSSGSVCRRGGGFHLIPQSKPRSPLCSLGLWYLLREDRLRAWGPGVTGQMMAWHRADLDLNPAPQSGPLRPSGAIRVQRQEPF